MSKMNKRIIKGVKKNPILKQAKTKAKIKVQLDARTVITIPDMSVFKLWTEKYPNAKVISVPEQTVGA